jgi:hypothetical protein
MIPVFTVNIQTELKLKIYKNCSNALFILVIGRYIKTVVLDFCQTAAR